jgi:zona occludens toxin (predicted ATPase)
MITGHVGTPGSGKTFNAVETVVKRFSDAGRTVCTNIHGIQPAKIGGDVRIFCNEQTLEAGFWPNRQGDGWCPNGSVIVFDELGLAWGDVKLPSFVIAAFREHRHFTGPNGENVEIHLLTQSALDFPRAIRGLIEVTYHYKKLSALNASKTFRWVAYQGYSPLSKNEVSRGVGKYKPAIFDLYSSTANSASVEPDKGRILGGLRSKLALVAVAVVLLIVGGARLVGFFSNSPEASAPQRSNLGVIAAPVPRLESGKMGACFGAVVLNGVRYAVCEKGLESPSSEPAVMLNAGF